MERKLSSAGLLPTRTKAQRQKYNSGLIHGWQKPNHLNHQGSGFARGWKREQTWNSNQDTPMQNIIIFQNIKLTVALRSVCSFERHTDSGKTLVHSQNKSEVRKQECNIGVPRGWQKFKYQSNHLRLPRHLVRGLNLRKNTQKLERNSDVGVSGSGLICAAILTPT